MVIKRKESFLGLKPLKPKALKDTITYLGASFIKLAQVLATRADFFSQEYLDELRQLHDQLPKMSDKNFNEIFNKAFHKNTFKIFHENPIACASIGQVHIAFLHDGTKVAVKLRRKGIKSQVSADIKIINFFNFLFKPLFSHYTKNSIEAVISEFSVMIMQEVSLTQELVNLQKFSYVYANEKIKFPIPYPELCCDDAIVMSFEEGFRFDDKENIFKHKIDFKQIISTLVNFYTTQMLIKGYFHADPHPGNILISKNGEIIFLDFGMVKSVPNDIRIAIIELIKAANEKDYELYISASKRLGTIAYEAPTSELAEFTEKMFEIFSNDNLNSESMQQLAFEVLESTRKMPFKLPSDAIYILRVSAIIEGLGTTYIENFNGVKDILPILKDNLPKALGAKDSIIETIKDEIKDIPFFVKDLKSVIKQANKGELKIEVSNNQLEWIAKEIKDFIRPIILSLALIFISIFTLLYDKDLKEISLGIFIIAIIRLVYRK
ncbi:membrane protein [Malaciobacter pacificus]|uniref:Putative ubiquinone biosynthesis protein kinase n=1 Tax=Malaciobacter pacificus TaxID=1080223 RepID=A0A5C2H7I3_9BACT|nr:AarF/UbiB family protein [Malaciobacter pacificus]QEP34299.1 putative ubiquinone biosynthesis protein kinase [Malaciobacter pacificus]GGD49338.1 membrane protein [Malaciobacter pacificus]